MAIRVVYGMAKQDDLPRLLGRVDPRTSTPLIATAAIAALSLACALVVPFEKLAEATSLSTLIVFALVNLALLKIHLSKLIPKPAIITVPLIFSLLGLLTSIAMIVSSLI